MARASSAGTDLRRSGARAALTRRPLRRAAATAAVLLLVTALAPLASSSAHFSRVAVTSIAGQSASSEAVRTRGQELAVAGTAAIRPPLTADAGPSKFVEHGAQVPLGGTVIGGVAPYRVRWSTPSGDAFSSTSALRTVLRTAQLPPGRSTVTLEVTDSVGRRATSEVVVVAAAPEVRVLLDAQDTLPPSPDAGTTGILVASRRHGFEVAAGVTSLDLRLAWQGSEDVDLRVADPSGVHTNNFSGSTADNPETIRIARPATGTWTAHVQGPVSRDTPYTLTVAAGALPADPRPRVTIDGPLRVSEGETQVVRATVAGGAGPFRFDWDLDGDGHYEAQDRGSTVTTSFGRGKHPVAVRVVDSGGLDARDLSMVVVAPRVAEPGTSLVVIAVIDTGINPYHEDFAASTYPDVALREATADFSQPPSSYIPGYPQDARALDLTLGRGYRPAEDERIWGAGHAQVPLGQLHWIPGTKIIGAIDGSDRSFNNAAADVTPLLDDDGHGTAASSVAVGNLYGSCQRCLLVFVENPGAYEWVYEQPWIDLVSQSFGSTGNVGAPGVFDPSQPRAAAERGQIALSAAGNGVENGFVTPEQTYLSSHTGPPWMLRIGAVERRTRKPIVGTGKPVDLASFGWGEIPSATAFSEHSAESFSGTSAATPITAGVIGRALGAARAAVGDKGGTARPPAVVAQGASLSSGPMTDGLLTRAELVDAVTHTAEHDGTATAVDPFDPVTTPDNPAQYLVEGYGIADDASAERAVDVVLGRSALPARPQEERFFAADQRLRRALWGGWSGGAADGGGPGGGAETGRDEVDPAEVATLSGALRAMRTLSGPVAPATPPDPARALVDRSGLPLFLQQDSCSDPSSRQLRISGSGPAVCELVSSGSVGGQGVWQAATPLLQTLRPGSRVTGELVLFTPVRRPLTGRMTLFAGTRRLADLPFTTVVLEELGAVRPPTEVTRIPFETSTDAAAVPGDVLRLVVSTDVAGPVSVVAAGPHRSLVVLTGASAAEGQPQVLPVAPDAPTVSIETPVPGQRVDPGLEPELLVTGRTSGFADPVARRYPHADGPACDGRAVDGSPRAHDHDSCLVRSGLPATGLYAQGQDFPFAEEDLPVALRSNDVVRGVLTVDGTFLTWTTSIQVLLGGRYRGADGQLVFANVASTLVVPAWGSGRQQLPFEMRVAPQRAGLDFTSMAFRVYSQGQDVPFTIVLSEGATFFDMPTGLEQRVDVSVDDDPATAVAATLGADRTWAARLDMTGLRSGPHALRARALSGATSGPPAEVAFEVVTPTESERATVEVAVVPEGAPPYGWTAVSDTSPGDDLSTWAAVVLLPRTPAAGSFDVHARLTRDGVPVARSGPWRVQRRG